MSRKSFNVTTPHGTSDFFNYYRGQTALPPFMRPVKSASALRSQFLDRKIPFVGEYPPYVLVFSLNQNGFFVVNTMNKHVIMNQVVDHPYQLCDVIGDVFWPPRSKEEENLSARSLIPHGSIGKLGKLQKETLESEREALRNLYKHGMAPELYQRLNTLNEILDH